MNEKDNINKYEYLKCFNYGNTYYNRKIKIVESKNKIKVVIKEYDSLLGSNNKNIEDSKIAINSSEVKEDNCIDINEVLRKDLDSFIRKDNLIRARNNIFDLARCNDKYWESFITFTFGEDVQDIEVANEKFNSWIKSIHRHMRKRNMTFYYLAVPEFQKNGRVHYHLLSNLVCGSDLLPLQKDKDNMYDVKYWNYGFSSAFSISKDVDSAFDTAKYMCKYITKANDDIRLYQHRRYLKSRNLKKPMEFNLMEHDITYQTILTYLMNSNDYEIINQYHHIPKEQYEKEYSLIEFECNKDNTLNVLDIVNSDLEF